MTGRGQPLERRKPAVAGFGHQEIGRMYLAGGRSKKVSALELPSLPDTPVIGTARRRL